MDILGQAASEARLRHMLKAGILDRAAFERALDLAGITPDGRAWRRFLDWLLAGLGAALQLSGIVFFFAYNWADMHRFSKFALLEGTLVIAVALAWRLGPDSQGGRAALFGAAVLPGVLLAVYGQVYQTGADPFKVMHDELYTVKVRISPGWARWVAEKNWHESQKITKLKDGSLEMTFRVAGWDEIKRWVLSFGPEAVVIEPAKLQEMVRKDLSRNLAQYSKPAVAINLMKEMRAV